MADKTTVRRFCFTLNNYTQEEYDSLVAFANKSCTFAVIGKELAPDTNTPHLQGFMHMKTPRRFSTVKNVCKRMHVEKSQGTDEQNFAYCTKTDKQAFVFGEIVKQGQRSDLDELKDAIKSGSTKLQLMEQFSELYAKYPQFVNEYMQEVSNSQFPREEIVEFRPWQQDLLDLLAQPSDNRHIIWVYDEKGGIGKSHLARWLVDHKNAFYTNGGKSIDITYAYNREPIVIFDYVRESQDFVSYSTIEQLKNGILSCNKYKSCMKRFRSPHVVVFANFEPTPGKFSSDRIILLTPAPEKCVDFIVM